MPHLGLSSPLNESPSCFSQPHSDVLAISNNVKTWAHWHHLGLVFFGRPRKVHPALDVVTHFPAKHSVWVQSFSHNKRKKKLYRNVHVLSGHDVLAQACRKVFLLRNPEHPFLGALEERRQHITGTVVCSSRSEAEISCLCGREWQQRMPLAERRCSEKAASKKDMDIQERFSVHLRILGEESWDFCIWCSCNSVMLLWFLFNCGSYQETIGSLSRKDVEGDISRLAGKKELSLFFFHCYYLHSQLV